MVVVVPTKAAAPILAAPVRRQVVFVVGRKVDGVPGTGVAGTLPITTIDGVVPKWKGRVLAPPWTVKLAVSRKEGCPWSGGVPR
jgi:hypothetical protein